MSGIVYKFLPAEFALKVLEEMRLKVSTPSELNDIYDFSPRTTPPQSEESTWSCDSADKLVKEMQTNYGLLCFSTSYASPLLWGHYARGATGLGLDSIPVALRWATRATSSMTTAARLLRCR